MLNKENNDSDTFNTHVYLLNLQVHISQQMQQDKERNPSQDSFTQQTNSQFQTKEANCIHTIVHSRIKTHTIHIGISQTNKLYPNSGSSFSA